MNMAWNAILCGALLVLVGIVGYGTAEPNTEGKVSPTALIPAFFGVLIGACGLLAFNEKCRKHAMHVAAMVALLGAIGGFMPLIRQYNKTGEFDPTKPSAIAGELMILICAVFVGLCVNSFIAAKKARKASAA